MRAVAKLHLARTLLASRKSLEASVECVFLARTCVGTTSLERQPTDKHTQADTSCKCRHLFVKCNFRKYASAESGVREQEYMKNVQSSITSTHFEAAKRSMNEVTRCILDLEGSYRSK